MFVSGSDALFASPLLSILCVLHFPSSPALFFVYQYLNDPCVFFAYPGIRRAYVICGTASARVFPASFCSDREVKPDDLVESCNEDPCPAR